MEIDLTSWPHRRDVRLNRFVFATRAPLPLPDGFRFDGPLGALGTGQSTDDVNWFSMVVHQVVGGPGAAMRAVPAVMQVARRERNEGSFSAAADALELQATWSVVDAVTPDETTTAPAPNLPAHARSWTADPLMRVMQGLRQLVRAERIGTQHLCAIPAYEQVMHPILAYRGTGEQLLAGPEVDARVIVTAHPEWDSPSMVLLEHGNVSLDHIQPRSEASQHDPVLGKWLTDLELEVPAVLWRERLLDARQQLQVEGRYDLAVILFATASEVLIDGLLQMLWWEQGLSDPKISVATVASSFDSTSNSLVRMNRYLSPLLGGDWSSAGGTVQTWVARTWKLRHQCVHGGYYPTNPEAVLARNSSEQFATFLFDRLAEKRARFPRVCLQLLAQSGLERRGMWNGKIKQFAEVDAIQEESWIKAFKVFRDQVGAARE